MERRFAVIAGSFTEAAAGGVLDSIAEQAAVLAIYNWVVSIGFAEEPRTQSGIRHPDFAAADKSYEIQPRKIFSQSSGERSSGRLVS